MQIRVRLDGIPWAMAAGRALLGPVVVVGERCGWSGAVLAGMVVTALFSDIFDGVLARRWGCDTAAVRLFDSMSDTLFYLCVAIAICIGHPQVWRDNAALLAVLMGLEALRLVLEFAKYGKPASYHSYLAKAWGLVMAIAVVGVFAWPGAAVLVPLALVLGIACDAEALVMSMVLPVWRKDVKTLRAALLLRKELKGECPLTAPAVKVTAIGALALCLLAGPAFAVQPGHAVYSGGSSGLARNTAGVLDTASPTALEFGYRKADGTAGTVEMKYSQITSVEPTSEQAHRWGILPMMGIVMLMQPTERHLLTVHYSDEAGVPQIAIFEVAKRDQQVLVGLVNVRSRGCWPGSPQCKQVVENRPVLGKR